MVTNIKTIILKIAPTVGTNNVVLASNNNTDITYNISNLLTGEITNCILSLDITNDSINVVSGLYNYKINFNDTTNLTLAANPLVMASSSAVIIPIFNSNSTTTNPVGYEIPNYTTYTFNTKTITQPMSVVGGGILTASDNTNISVVNESTYYTLSLFKLDIEYSSSLNNSSNFKMNLQPTGSTGGTLATASLNREFIVQIGIDFNGALSIQTLNNNSSDIALLTIITDLAANFTLCTKNLATYGDTSGDSLAIAKAEVNLLLQQYVTTLNENPIIANDSTIVSALSNLINELNILATTATSSANFTNAANILFTNFHNIFDPIYSALVNPLPKFIPAVNILLNQDNFTDANTFATQKGNWWVNSINAYIISQTQSFSGINKTSWLMEASPVNNNFNQDVVWMSYGPPIQAYNTGSYNYILPQVVPPTLNVWSGGAQMFITPMVQIKKTLISPGIYKLQFIRHATNYNLQQVNYSSYAFYNAPVNGLLYPYWSGQGYGTGLGFLNITPELANKNLNFKTDIMITLTIYCDSMDWDYNAAVDSAALLNTRVTLSIQGYQGMTAIGLNHAWLWNNLPSLANQLTILNNLRN